MTKKSTSKKLIFMIILAAVAIVSLVTTGILSTTAHYSKPPEKLRVLAIGNSFSYDSLYYVYDMADDIGVEKIAIAYLYKPDCDLKQHYNNAKNNKSRYMYFKNKHGKWKKHKHYTIKKALENENWDYVIFSQYSSDAGKEETYKYLKKLEKTIKPKLRKHTQIVWNMTWAYQSDFDDSRFRYYNSDQIEMYNSIVNATKKKVRTDRRISCIIPTGTAIQNARTSSYGDNFTRDGRHLSKKGKYVASMTVLSKLTNINPDTIKFRPKRVSKKKRKMAIQAVKWALKRPYKITAFEGYEEPEVVELTEVDETNEPTKPPEESEENGEPQEGEIPENTGFPEVTGLPDTTGEPEVSVTPEGTREPDMSDKTK